ncbi:MAG: hypothetical protein IKB80_01785 [Oscillospiraceae bacterium]|nr:hypothetical protein [Oscillospiraceae bacterium]
MKNKVLAILMSFAVAMGLWLYVITVVSPESEKDYYDIPVVIQNKNILSERGLMIVSEEPKVTLSLKSDRTILNDLNESNINVITNVANIEKPGTYHLTYNITYPGNIQQGSVSVQSSSTDLITVEVENKIKKTVPVVIDRNDTTVPEGYMADLENANLDFTSIEISGPESVVEQIEQAIVDIDLTDKTKTLAGEYQYSLCDKQGMPVNAEKVTVNAEKVNLVVTVQRVKEIALKLDVIYGGGATEENCSVTMDTTQIQVSGNDTLLENLNEVSVGTLNLAEVLEDQVLTFKLDDVLPEGVTNLTGVEEVTVQIKFTGLTTKTFNVTKISAGNVPEGLHQEIITKALSVTVRGTEKSIKAIKSEDLSVEVDLSEAQVGTASMTAKVVVSESFPDVGAVGTYQVSVKLREQ